MEDKASSPSEKSSILPSKTFSSPCFNKGCSKLALPPHWFHKHSRSHEGKVYFAHSIHKKVFWQLPPFQPCEANCHKCKKYSRHLKKKSTICAKISRNSPASSTSKDNSRIEKCTNSQNLVTEGQNKGLVDNGKITDEKSSCLTYKNFDNTKNLKSKKELNIEKCIGKDSKSTSLNSNTASVSHRPRHQFGEQLSKENDCVELRKSSQLTPFLHDEQPCATSSSSLRNLSEFQSSCAKILPFTIKSKAKSNATQKLTRKKSFSNLKEKIFGVSLVRPIFHARRTSIAKNFCETNNGYKYVERKVSHLSEINSHQPKSSSSYKRRENVCIEDKLFKRKKIKLDSDVQVSSSTETLYPSDEELAISTPLKKIYALPPALETCAFESMDVDCNSITSANSGCNIKCCGGQEGNSTLWIVVDTNLLVHELPLIRSLSCSGAVHNKYKKIMLLIPQTAIRELDSLKKDSKCQIEAQIAVKWINKMLTQSLCVSSDENFVNGANNVCGQSLKNYNDLRDNRDCKNGDDHILDYCLWLQRQGHEVLLLSNDVNFRNKAILAEVPSVSSKSLAKNITWAEELPEAACMNQSSRVHCDKKSSSSPNLRYNIQKIVHSEYSDVHMNDVSLDRAVNDANFIDHSSSCGVADRLPVFSSSSERISRSHFSPSSENILSSLKSTLSNILTARMESVFSELWLKIVIQKPPWSLHDLFLCWEKHWVAVFTDIFPRVLQNDLKHLKKMLSDKNTEEKLYEQLCKVYNSLSTGKFSDLIVYPKYDSMESAPDESSSPSPNMLDSSLGIVAPSVDLNRNVISYTNSCSSKPTSSPEVCSLRPKMSTSVISSNCTATNVLQTEPLLISGYPSPSFCDNSMLPNAHATADESSVEESRSFDWTSSCRGNESVDQGKVAAAHDAVIATGEKMRNLVHEGLSSLSESEGAGRQLVLESLHSLRSCIRAFRLALARCRGDPSASNNMEQLRSAVVAFWDNVHDHNRTPALVFHADSDVVVVSALFRSEGESFWLTCLKHLWEMETALNAELPEASPPQ